MLNQIVVALELNQPKIRSENFLGREFCVVPAVLVRSQVLRNNLGVTFLPAAELTSEWAGLWNGIPVLVGPHPTQRGVPMSGRDPQLWNERCAGWIFHAKIGEEGSEVKHLAGEVWLDRSRASAVDGLQSVLDKLEAGERVELSTGFQAQLVATQGNFQGTAYEAIMHPAGADHLVISTEMTGACSVSDGCGLGVNRYEGTPPMENTDTPAPEAGTKTGGATEETPPKVEATEQSLWSRVRARFTKQRETADNTIEAKFKLDEHNRALNALPVSDAAKESRIRAALQEKHGSVGDIIVADVFSADSVVVFWMITPFGPEPQGSNYFRVTFSEGEGGEITFSEPEKVRRVTAYEPVGNEAGEPSRTATNCNCAPKEGATMSDKNKEQEGIDLATLTKAISDLTSTVANLATDVAGIKKAAEQDPNPAIAGLKKSIGELAGQVQSMSTVTKSAVEERERERQNLVASLAGNYRCAFTAEELETKPLVELRKLAEMTNADYSARGGPRGAQNSSDQRFAEPVAYWEKPKPGQGQGGN